MNQGKRCGISIFLMAIMILTLVGCSKETKKENSNSTSKSTYQLGLDVISLMCDLTESDTYIKTMSSTDELEELVKEVAKGDYKTPKSVYSVSSPTVTDLLKMTGEELDFDSLPKDIQEYMDRKMLTYVTTQINARQGTAALAASTILSVNKVCVCDQLKESCIYFYVFENGKTIAITYDLGENGAVSVTGTFIANDEFSVDSADQLEGLMKDTLGYGECKVTEVEMK